MKAVKHVSMSATMLVTFLFFQNLCAQQVVSSWETISTHDRWILQRSYDGNYISVRTTNADGSGVSFLSDRYGGNRLTFEFTRMSCGVRALNVFIEIDGKQVQRTSECIEGEPSTAFVVVQPDKELVNAMRAGISMKVSAGVELEGSAASITTSLMGLTSAGAAYEAYIQQ